MNKGRISGHKILARLSFMAAVTLIHMPVVQAQQNNPEVFVDMSVLQGLGSVPAQQPIKLKPPVLHPPASRQPVHPRLIAPTQQAPAYTPPAPVPVPKAVASNPVLPKPVISRPVVTEAPRVKPAVANKTAYVSKPPAMPADEVRRAIVAPEPMSLKSAPPPPVIQPPVMAEPIAAVATSDPVPVVPPVIQEALPEIKTVPPQMAAIPEKAVAFPLVTKIRQETSDPTVSDSSRPVPVRSGIAGNLKDVVPSRPAPDMDPAAAPVSEPVPVRDLTEEDVAAVPVEKNVMVPPAIPSRKPAPVSKVVAAAPKTPDMVEKASPELVAQLRAREAEKEIQEVKQAMPELKKQSVDLANPAPPPGPRGKKNMPAVAKAAVESEALAEQIVQLPVNNDPLLDSLVEKDKESLVSAIESMVAEREDGKPLPKSDKPKREIGTSIVKAEPMQRPYNVYRPNKIEDGVKEDNSDIEKTSPHPAPLPEGEGKEMPRPPAPRAQDEQAYISVPFAEGLTKLDEKATTQIAESVLSVLNDNPAWKLQIQAFASPVKDGVSSARKASLDRAMSVREYLLSKGIEATRMDVRALGAESDRDPMDRVDLIVFDPAKKS